MLHLGIFYMPQICGMGPRQFYFPSEGRRAEDFLALKNLTALARFEPANLGTKGQHATSRPLKLLPLCLTVMSSNIPLHYSKEFLVMGNILPSLSSRHPYSSGTLICVLKKQRFVEFISHGK
jgi:hypothetical protein